MKQLKEIARRLGVTLLDLVTSKKAIASAVAAIAALVVKDPGQRDHVVYILMTFVGGQSLVDHAKAQAEKTLGLEGAKPLPIAVVDSPGTVIDASSSAAPAAPAKPSA